MTEREALLRAVCENPDDDTPRLVFADWLDENGEPERAEFVRVQVELTVATDPARRGILENREGELLAAHQRLWDEQFHQFNTRASGYPRVRDISYRRGFAFGVEIVDNEDDFADYAAELLGLAPIRRVVLWQKYQHEKLSRCPALMRLTELRTDRAGFEPDELRFLFDSQHLANLTRLELIADDDNAHLCRDGLKLLGCATAFPRLRHLDISGNWCNWLSPDEGDWITALIDGPLVGQLESLRLAATFLNDTGAEALAQCRRLSALTDLCLAGNMIGERGLRALAESPYLSQLAVLNLRSNHCENDDGVEIGVCGPETRRLLEARFGNRVLLDGPAYD